MSLILTHCCLCTRTGRWTFFASLYLLYTLLIPRPHHCSFLSLTSCRVPPFSSQVLFNTFTFRFCLSLHHHGREGPTCAHRSHLPVLACFHVDCLFSFLHLSVQPQKVFALIKRRGVFMRIQCLFPLFFFPYIIPSFLHLAFFFFKSTRIPHINFLPSFPPLLPWLDLHPLIRLRLLPFHFHQLSILLVFFFFFFAFRRVFFLAFFLFFLRWQLQYCTSHFLPSVPA